MVYDRKSLEVKLPTIWTDGKAEVGKVREEKVSRKNKNKVREKRGKSRNTDFQMFWGSGRSKSRLAKAACAEPSGQMRDEKLHAVVARSTFRSQHVKNHTALHYTTLHYNTTLQHSTRLHYTTLHYIALHYSTALHYTTLQHYTTTLHYNTALDYITLHYTTLHYATAQHYTTLHYTTLQHYTTTQH